MNRFTKVLFSVLLCSLIVAVPSLWATWIDDGVPVCTATGNQFFSEITSDGSGGTIVTWKDYRSGTNDDVYVQWIDASGAAGWTADGVPLCTATGSQQDIQVTSDGTGGAIAAWEDWRGGPGDIYVQRIDASGTVQWTSDGVPICTAAGNQLSPQIVSDGAGGAFITWMDSRSMAQFDIYVQRVSASGTVQWTADGISLCTAAGNQEYPQITTDGTGGVIVTWQDNRSGNYDVYVQRVNASGAAQWTADGVPLCTATGNQQEIQVTSDGAGGAIVTWHDSRVGDYDIYTQRVNASGAVQWTSDGVPICTATGNQHSPELISDGVSGAIVTWYDYRSGNWDIYTQHINASGVAQWTADGVPLCTATGDQLGPQVTTDGAGGAIVTWEDYRSGDYDIYIQRVNASGAVQWTADGVPVCVVTWHQYEPRIMSDGVGGAIMTWQDSRNGNYDIYAQQIDSRGRTGYFPPTIYSVNDVPGDEGGYVNLTWEASPLDYHLGKITEYTIWRALEASAAAAWLSSGASIVSSPMAALETSPVERENPVLRHASLNGEMFFWELVASQAGYRLRGYGRIVQTAFDSTSVCSDYHYFQIIAHTSDPSIYYISDPDSGYSVDNLSPCPPMLLAGEQLYAPEGLNITWEHDGQPDVDCYRIYRGTDEYFVPGPGNLLVEPCAPEHFDDTWAWDEGYYYKVSAVDIHGNESDFALLGPAEITGDDTPATPQAAYLQQNYPNPFNPSTTISFGLSEAGPVSLKIYDAAGRLVRVIIDETLPAAHYSEGWDGKDGSGIAVASGVYFYRLSTKTFTENRKMILLR